MQGNIEYFFIVIINKIYIIIKKTITILSIYYIINKLLIMSGMDFNRDYY